MRFSLCTPLIKSSKFLIETDRDKYNLLAAITDSGQTTLTAAFTQAINNAETAADAPDAAYQQHLGNLARIAQGRRAAQALHGRGKGGGARGGRGIGGGAKGGPRGGRGRGRGRP